jgi:hypothetical protein
MEMIKIFLPTELLKAKYTKRWRGKDGKWHYEYGKLKAKPKKWPSMTNSEKRKAYNIAIKSGDVKDTFEGFSAQMEGSNSIFDSSTGRLVELGGRGKKSLRYGNVIATEDQERVMKKSIVSAVKLQKAKYTKRWRGKDGKWHYEYGSRSPRIGGDLGETSGQKIKRATEILEGRNLPRVGSYSEVPDPPKVTTKTRKSLNNALRSALPGNYYNGIPIGEMQEALRKEGYVLIQEDGTKWSGMFLGSEGEAFLQMGKLDQGRNLNGQATYKPVSNSGLRMTWYEMPSGKMEIVKYIT